MIERLLLWIEHVLRPPRPRVTDERYPLRHWRVVRCCQEPFDHEHER